MNIDITFEGSNKHDLKIKIAKTISDFIATNKVTQKNASLIMGISQPRLSNLVNGKVSNFSIDSLLDILESIGFAISIKINREEIPFPDIPENKQPESNDE